MSPYHQEHWHNIHSEIQAVSQFVLWREDQKPGKTKPDKVPLDHQTWLFSNAHDSANWLAFDQACALALQQAVGIGFVLTPHDPFACIDLDGCIGPGDVLSLMAREIALGFPGAWIERSHSGQGLHIWVKGAVPGGGRRGNGIEAYSAKRFIALTGKAFHL